MRRNRAKPLNDQETFLGISGVAPVLELGIEPGTGVSPVTLGGCERDLHHSGDLGHGQAGEEAELDQLGLRGVFLRLGVPTATEKKTTNLVCGSSSTAFSLLETRLRRADSRNRIRERLSRTKDPGDDEVSPEGLGASRLPHVFEIIYKQVKLIRSLLFSPLLSEPRFLFSPSRIRSPSCVTHPCTSLSLSQNPFREIEPPGRSSRGRSSRRSSCPRSWPPCGRYSRDRIRGRVPFPSPHPPD
jgi:hypothetical protein